MINVKNQIKISAGEKVFDGLNILFMCILILIMVYPVWHVICYSFSSPVEIMKHKGLVFLPLKFSFKAYMSMLQNPMILRGYINTIYIVAVSLIFNVLLTSIGAYVVSRKNALLSAPVMVMIVFTMYFSGGMIPTYFTIKDLGLLDSLWSVILPAAINTFNLIILKTAFLSIPDSIEESARIDGAGHYLILFGIILPLAKASLSVIILYYAVSHWNSWFNAMLYLNKRELFPLQLVLREILIQNNTSDMTIGVDTADRALIAESIKYAVIVVATLPILCIYPFIQKYFTKGVMIGAVKG
jgi:putative aldouronate transport system permease protein